jgi:hypothetical protein
MKVTIGRAINLLFSGFSVIPIGEQKRPLISWKKYQSEQITKEELEKHSSSQKCNGFGIITGYNGLECIDVDLKVFESLQDQKNFWNEFLQMLKDHIDDFDRKFVIYKTINSGYHIIYRCNNPEGNRKIATLKGHSSAIIETRGKGGYIFIYENQQSKLSYEDVQIIDNDDRSVLFGLCKYFDYTDEKDNNIPYEENEGLTPWDDFNQRTKATDLISDEFDVVRNLTDRYVLRKKGSSDALHGFIYKDSGLCYLFTTATIYPHEKPLSPFSLYSYKFHTGNFSQSAKELYKKGFGERKKRDVAFETEKENIKGIEFPIEIFPKNVQAYMIESNKSLNLVIDYMGCSLLWAISLIIGNSIKIEVKPGWKESANIWLGLIGNPGIGKTPSINAILFPLLKKNAFEIKQYQSQYKKWKEYLDLDKDQRKNVEEVKQPTKKQFVVNDVTIEALIELHEHNPNSIGVHKDELNGWMKDMNKYKQGSDLEFWLSSWSNQQAILTRKTSSSSFIDSPCIQVIGGIQPGIFSQIATDENKSNGFSDRLLVSYPDLNVPKYNENYIDQEMIDWFEGYMIGFYNSIMNSILTFNEFGEIKPWVITWTEEANKEWVRIFNEITEMQNSDEENEFVKSMLSKQKSYIPRFAMYLNCLYSYDEPTDSRNINWVQKDAIIGAEKLSKYFINMSKKIKFGSIESKNLRDVLKELDSKPINEKIKLLFEIIPNANKTEVAELLNCSRKTIYKHLK